MAGWPTEKPASMTVRGIGRAKLMEDGSLKIKDEETGDLLKFAPDKIPDYVKKLELGGGKFAFALNGKKDQVYSLHPAEGAFLAKFDSFQTGKDEKLPTPHHQTGPAKNAQGQTYQKDYWTFQALCRIIEGPFDGIIIPYFLRYDPFYAAEDAGKQVVGIKLTKHGERLMEFMDTVGVKDSLPWSDNILPDLMKRILKADRKFRIVVKKGYIDSVLSEEGVDFNDPDDAEKDDDLN